MESSDDVYLSADGARGYTSLESGPFEGVVARNGTTELVEREHGEIIPGRGP